MSVSIHFNDLESLIGKNIGSTDWMTITQQRINAFADATDDPQWIHVDPERAKTGPYGTTVAHGYLTLSLIVPLFTDLLQCDGVTAKVNYGLNKVRWPAPVKVDSNIRLTVTHRRRPADQGRRQGDHLRRHHGAGGAGPSGLRCPGGVPLLRLSCRDRLARAVRPPAPACEPWPGGFPSGRMPFQGESSGSGCVTWSRSTTRCAC